MLRKTLERWSALGFLSFVAGFLALAMAGCGCDPFPEFDPSDDRFTGEEAKLRLEDWVGRKGRLPESAHDFYIYDGGNFNGTIVYASFDCASREDCESAVIALGAPCLAEFQPWTESQYAVVMEGPGFYHNSLRNDPWDVKGIQNGVVSERVQGDHRSMYYYAIDLDRNRVYYHRESGGFPSAPFHPKSKAE